MGYKVLLICTDRQTITEIKQKVRSILGGKWHTEALPYQRRFFPQDWVFSKAQDGKVDLVIIVSGELGRPLQYSQAVMTMCIDKGLAVVEIKCLRTCWFDLTNVGELPWFTSVRSRERRGLAKALTAFNEWHAQQAEG